MNEVKTNQELTDEIAHYFADISGNFVPIDRSLIPCITPPDAPFVSEVNCFPEEHEVYTLLKSSKKTASVPHDLPIVFIKEFLPELSKPAADIYGKVLQVEHFRPDGRMSMFLLIPKLFLPNLAKIFAIFLLQNFFLNHLKDSF